MSRTLETKQKKEYSRLKGRWDPCLKTWGFEKFIFFFCFFLFFFVFFVFFVFFLFCFFFIFYLFFFLRSSCLESLRVTVWEEKKYARTVSKTHQESQCFWDFECRSTYFQTVFISSSPILREYNQTLLYGHPINTDTSFITDGTVCFIPGENSPYIFSELNPLNTDTLLIRTFSMCHH